LWQYHNVQLLTSHIHSAMQQLLEVVSSTHINLTTVAWWQSQFNEKLAEKFSEHKSPAGLLITAVLTNSTAIPLAKICQKVNCNIVCNPEYGKHCTKPNSAVSILSVQLYDRERRQNSKHQNEKVAISAKCSAVSLLVSDGKCATGSDILSWKSAAIEYCSRSSDQFVSWQHDTAHIRPSNAVLHNWSMPPAGWATVA